METRLLSFFFVLCAAFVGAGEAPPANEGKAAAAFEAEYELGAAAAVQKKWGEAEKHFDAGLKALGEFPHAKKAVAQVLLKKAREMAAQDAGLATAAELLRLKQWAEAEAAYKKAAETLGETDEIKKGIAAAQAGARAEKDTSAAKTPTPPAPAATTPVMPPPAPEKKPETAGDAAEAPLPVPEPIELNRDQWEKGTGSSCYWAGERLFLEEGDEYFKKILTKDFAASVAIEAQMDHRSRISIELRPVKDSGTKVRVIGWGSKDGSPPTLTLDKDVKATGDARPPQQQITLSLVRTGRKIEFHCNGKLVGHVWDSKLRQPYHLVVSGKGILNGAKVVER